MTREDILAMDAGRDLDALVAEKVMGFTGIRFGRNDPSAVWIGESRKFQPSSDISASWEIVEKMRSKNWWIVLNSEGETWDAFYWDPHQQACEAEAKTAPEAIVKAALLAVMEEIA